MSIVSADSGKPVPIEIVPGRSVGPVELGMTRDQVRSLGLGVLKESKESIFFLMASGPYAREGITADFDAAGRCCRIEAFFSSGPPLFRLRGRIVNGLAAGVVEEIFRGLTPDIRHSYGAIEAPAAGISGVKWERDDVDLCAIDVFPASRP